MVYVLLGTGFEEVEAIAPVDLLRRAGIEVKTVGITGKTVFGSHRIGVEADILPEEIEALAIVPGEDLVTLMTCTPYAVNTHRLLVRGHRIPYTQQQQDDAKSTFHVDIPLQYLLPSLALIALLLAWHLWQRHERRRRQSGSTKVASGDSDSADIEPDGDLPPQPANTNNQSHSSRRKGPGRHVRPA